jgi:predicted nucleic acid-binding protein
MNGLLLIDTSTWHRSGHPAVVGAWAEALTLDRAAVTPPAKLEILFSARSARDYARLSTELNGLHQIACGVDAAERAVEVQGALARRRALHHRSVGIVDLLIAAAAELAGATVWHYDEDYDRIAAITGQPTEWVVPRGSL